MADGTIYDLAYKRYEGTRTSRDYRWTVICRSAVLMQLRQWWVKGVLVLALPLLSVRALLMAGTSVLGAGTANARADAEVGSYGIGCQGFTTFLLLLVCGAPAIAADLNAGAFQFYFARPVSPGQYLAGRVTGASLLAVSISVLSLAVLAIERVALGGHLSAVALVVLKAIGPLLLRVLSITAMSLGVSSLTRRKGIAQATYAGTVVASYILTVVLANVEDQPWIRWLDVTGGATALGDQLLGVLHLHGWRAAVPGASTAFWIVASLAVAFERLRRAEVVRG